MSNNSNRFRGIYDLCSFALWNLPPLLLGGGGALEPRHALEHAPDGSRCRSERGQGPAHLA